MKIQFLGVGTYREDGAHDSIIPLQEQLSALARQGFDVELAHASDRDAFVKQAIGYPGDVLIGCFSPHGPAGTVADAWRRIRESRPRFQLIHFDCYDPINSRHWDALPFVDQYWKSHRHAQLETAASPSATGCPFPDFAGEKGYADVTGWHYKSTFPLAEVRKIKSAWNYGAMGRYEKLLKVTSRVSVPQRWRPIDINLRFSMQGAQKNSWYHGYRQRTYDELKKLGGVRFTSPSRISFKSYLAEMALSKIVVSPFGWGEVCYRDYEAMATKALLIKPSMDHVAVTPGLYVPNETYVPVKWDLSDLREVCRHYLADWRARSQITSRAFCAYRDSFRPHPVLFTFQTHLT